MVRKMSRTLEPPLNWPRVKSAGRIANPMLRDACETADAGYIESVNGKDIDVVKNKNEVTASASWTRKLPLVANVSLLLDFEATATR